MDAKEFDSIIDRRVSLIKRTIGSDGHKTKEYMRGDRFSNFKFAAAIDDEIPERALWGMLKKHIISVKDLIESMEERSIDNEWIDGPPFTQMYVDEKIGDTINYLILLEGLIAERMDG